MSNEGPYNDSKVYSNSKLYSDYEDVTVDIMKSNTVTPAKDGRRNTLSKKDDSAEAKGPERKHTVKKSGHDDTVSAGSDRSPTKHSSVRRDTLKRKESIKNDPGESEVKNVDHPPAIDEAKDAKTVEEITADGAQASTSPDNAPTEQVRTGQWSAGLFDIGADPKLAAMTFAFPCYTFGRTNALMGTACICCGVLYAVPIVGFAFGAFTREKIRKEKGILGSHQDDFIKHFFCPCCAVLQDAKEVRASPNVFHAYDSSEPPPPRRAASSSDPTAGPVPITSQPASAQ